MQVSWSTAEVVHGKHGPAQSPIRTARSHLYHGNQSLVGAISSFPPMIADAALAGRPVARDMRFR